MEKNETTQEDELGLLHWLKFQVITLKHAHARELSPITLSRFGEIYHRDEYDLCSQTIHLLNDIIASKLPRPQTIEGENEHGK
jgi:hypothetical protein